MLQYRPGQAGILALVCSFAMWSLCGTSWAGAATTHGQRLTSNPARHAVRRHHPAKLPAVCPNAGAFPGTVSAPAIDAAVVCLTNQQRVHYGLPVLAENGDLNRSAQQWTDTMVSTDTFTHGADFSQRITAAGYVWLTVGENIATGFTTPSDVVTAWMASFDHCQNILNPVYADIGVGVNAAAVTSVVAEGATWTQDFGLTMAAPVPSRNTGPMNGCPYTG